MSAIGERVIELYAKSEGFTVETSIKIIIESTEKIVLSVCPLHTLQASEPCFWTMEELYRFYDNYGQHQIDEMVATKNYPMHLTVIHKVRETSTTLLETDADICLVSLDEVIELVENSLK